VPENARKSPGADREDVLKGRYSRPGASGLKVTVKTGDNEMPLIDVR
jgi:hypothetical protein